GPCRTGRTSCTAPTRPSRRPARSRSGSPTWPEGRPAHPPPHRGAGMVNAFVHLHTERTSVLLDLTEGLLPAVVHWGGDLGDLDAEQVVALARTRTRPAAGNEPRRGRLAVL